MTMNQFLGKVEADMDYHHLFTCKTLGEMSCKFIQFVIYLSWVNMFDALFAGYADSIIEKDKMTKFRKT